MEKAATIFKKAAKAKKGFEAAKMDRLKVQDGLVRDIEDSILPREEKDKLKESAKNALGFAPEYSEATYAGISRATKDEIIYLESKERERSKKQSKMKREFAKTKR